MAAATSLAECTISAPIAFLYVIVSFGLIPSFDLGCLAARSDIIILSFMLICLLSSASKIMYSVIIFVRDAGYLRFSAYLWCIILLDLALTIIAAYLELLVGFFGISIFSVGTSILAIGNMRNVFEHPAIVRADIAIRIFKMYIFKVFFSILEFFKICIYDYFAGVL